MKYYYLSSSFVVPGDDEEHATEEFLENYFDSVTNLFNWDITELTKEEAIELGYPAEEE